MKEAILQRQTPTEDDADDEVATTTTTTTTDTTATPKTEPTSVDTQKVLLSLLAVLYLRILLQPADESSIFGKRKESTPSSSATGSQPQEKKPRRMAPTLVAPLPK